MSDSGHEREAGLPFNRPLVGQSGKAREGWPVGRARIPVWTAMRSEGTGEYLGLETEPEIWAGLKTL